MDRNGHFAGRHELLLNGVELDHWKADCRVRPVSVFLCLMAARLQRQVMSAMTHASARNPSMARASTGLAMERPALRAHSASAAIRTPLPLALSPLGK